MLIGRFGKIFLQMGVEGNGESAQNFDLIHSGLVAAEWGMRIHMLSLWVAFSSCLMNASR